MTSDNILLPLVEHYFTDTVHVKHQTSFHLCEN